MFAFLLWITTGCQTQTELEIDTYTDPTPNCMDEQTLQNWERLGSPINSEELTPVAPALIVVDNELWLYLSLRENLNDTVVLSKSSDGLNWSQPTPVTGLDFQAIKHLNISQTQDGFRGFVGGGTISQIRSSDGLFWDLEAENIVPSSDFDTWGQLYPAQDSTGSKLWYSGFSGETYSIGLVSLEGSNWINRGVVLQHDVSAEYENTAVAQTAILEHSSNLIMWYGGYDTSNTDPGPWRILAAQSADGIMWNKMGLALDLYGEEEAWSVREPSVALWDEQLWMAYIALGSDSTYRVRLARCTD